jgi:hypothetical protein
MTMSRLQELEEAIKSLNLECEEVLADDDGQNVIGYSVMVRDAETLNELVHRVRSLSVNLYPHPKVSTHYYVYLD